MNAHENPPYEADAHRESKLAQWFHRLSRSFGARDAEFVTAQEAYNTATYGDNMNIDKWIRKHQQNINELIRTKMSMTGTGFSAFNSYYLAYDLTDEDNLVADKIFAPFIARGFKVVNISERIGELLDSHVYLICWKKPSRLPDSVTTDSADSDADATGSL